MTKKNAFYAQSGGVTAVINASAAGVIEAVRQSKIINNLYAGKNGILGAIQEEIIDTSKESIAAIRNLKHTPGGAFGSCRYKLGDYSKHNEVYDRVLSVFQAHNIGYFFYNGGNDSQDTTNKLAQLCKLKNIDIQCIGIPKTIDNDLVGTDNCPGFGSVAKYVAISTMEAGLDVTAMAKTSTKVFVLEVMGRNAGWIAAAAGLASSKEHPAPHIILFPEVKFQQTIFLQKVKQCIAQYGHCTVVVSEGIKNARNELLAKSNTKDAFGHAQLGGAGPVIANIINKKLGYKCHYAIADYLQRSAAHIASKTDVEQAYKLGYQAVKYAEQGKTAVMPAIVRTSNTPYKWSIKPTALYKTANLEKKLPASFISKDKMHITKKCIEYLKPLVTGEIYPKYKQGLPVYTKLKNVLLAKKLPKFSHKSI